MSTIDAARKIAHTLTVETGLRVTVDPRNANPPCVLIVPPRLVFNRNCGATAQWAAVAMAPGPGNADAWATLDKMVAAIEQVLPLESADPDDYATDNTNALAAYRLRWTGHVDLEVSP